MKLSAAKQQELELHDAKLAEQYDKLREADPIGKHYQEYWAERMLLQVPKKTKPKVLDYCCGTSILYPLLTRRIKDLSYVGIDLSPEMLAVGKKRYAKKAKKAKNAFKLLQRDGEDLRLAEKFDIVIARGAIHHLPKPQKGLKEIAKVLKKDGVLIISEPAANPVLKGARWVMYQLSSHFSSSHRSFTYGELMKIIQKAKYDIVRVERFGFFAYSFGFPDIIPFSKLMPRWLFPVFIKTDELIGKVPFLRGLSFSVIITARPK